ncbi:MAG: hypothetical protein A3D28_05670 [Omnitrophica bacterium RIFCSPHIGHO2_02_FULL_63_14]|nr:MAG: hypothetical protein A3D28_05670 [Omnitrophica bacterium RIFCSPHIGHO2_02_FULL_63_14]
MALELGLTGFVKNLSDGRVEVVCEGPRERVEKLLDGIKKSQLAPYIKGADTKWETPRGEFNDFTVEFIY